MMRPNANLVSRTGQLRKTRRVYFLGLALTPVVIGLGGMLNSRFGETRAIKQGCKSWQKH